MANGIRGKAEARTDHHGYRERDLLCLCQVTGFVTAENTHVLLSPYTPSAKLNLLTEINKCLI